MAAYTQAYKVCLLLLQTEGLNLNSVTSEGSTILHYLSRRAPAKEDKATYLKLLATVLKKGADVDIVNNQGESALHSASLGGNFQAVRFLMLNGSQHNVTSQMGYTPLQYAIESHHHKIVNFLTEWVDPRQGDCLELATKFKYPAQTLTQIERRIQALVAWESAEISQESDAHALSKFESHGFELSHPDEKVVATFICAGHTSEQSIARHGRMFLTTLRLCFHSSLIGSLKIDTSYRTIRAVRPGNPLQTWVPNALTVFSKADTYFFSQFMVSKDHAFDLLCSLWLGYPQRFAASAAASELLNSSGGDGHFKPRPNNSVDLSLPEQELPYEPPSDVITSPQIPDSPSLRLRVVQADPSASNSTTTTTTTTSPPLPFSSSSSSPDSSSATNLESDPIPPSISHPLHWKSSGPVSQSSNSRRIRAGSRTGSDLSSSDSSSASSPAAAIAVTTSSHPPPFLQRRSVSSATSWQHSSSSITSNVARAARARSEPRVSPVIKIGLVAAAVCCLFAILLSFFFSQTDEFELPNLLPPGCSGDNRRFLLSQQLAEMQQYEDLLTNVRSLRHRVSNLRRVQQLIDQVNV